MNEIDAMFNEIMEDVEHYDSESFKEQIAFEEQLNYNSSESGAELFA